MKYSPAVGSICTLSVVRALLRTARAALPLPAR